MIKSAFKFGLIVFVGAALMGCSGEAANHVIEPSGSEYLTERVDVFASSSPVNILAPRQSADDLLTQRFLPGTRYTSVANSEIVAAISATPHDVVEYKSLQIIIKKTGGLNLCHSGVVAYQENITTRYPELSGSQYPKSAWNTWQTLRVPPQNYFMTVSAPLTGVIVKGAEVVGFIEQSHIGWRVGVPSWVVSGRTIDGRIKAARIDIQEFQSSFEVWKTADKGSQPCLQSAPIDVNALLKSKGKILTEITGM